MGMEFYNCTIRKARVNHLCEYCGDIIAKRQQYSYESGKYSGEIFTRKLHIHCHAILCDALHGEDGDEFTWDIIDDYLDEVYCHTCIKTETCDYRHDISRGKCPIIIKEYSQQGE